MTNQGVQLLREIASTTENFLGDGTTTAMVLARAILQRGLPACRGRCFPGVHLPGHRLSRSGRRRVDPGSGAARWRGRDLARVATIASRDEHIGELVADALTRVGADGVVRIEDDRAYGIKLDFHEGMRFDNGLLSPGLASDRRLGESVFEQPYV